MMNWMNRIENKGDNLTQILALRPAFKSICVLRDLRNTICSDSGTVRGDCVKGNLSKRDTDTQTK